MLHPHNLQLVSHLSHLPLHLTVLVFLLAPFLYFMKLLLFLHNDIRFIGKSLHEEGTMVTPAFNVGFSTFKVVSSLIFHWFRRGSSSLLLIWAVKRKTRVRGVIVKTLLVLLELISQISDTFFLQYVRMWRNVALCLVMCLGETLLWNLIYFKCGLPHVLLHKLILSHLLRLQVTKRFPIFLFRSLCYKILERISIWLLQLLLHLIRKLWTSETTCASDKFFNEGILRVIPFIHSWMLPTAIIFLYFSLGTQIITSNQFGHFIIY